jgi:hypothetical protein
MKAKAQSSKRIHENTGKVYYNGPDPTRKQRKFMPARFRLPVSEWPVYRILASRGPPGEEEYLVDWEANPLDGNIYEPSWVRGNESCPPLERY